MFTGIISDVGRLRSRDGAKFTIDCAYGAASIALGASIACDGCCLTVTEIGPGDDGGSRFSADVSNETLACTTLGNWQAGRAVNLERALTLGDEFGGHIVTGHVDAVVRLTERRDDGTSVRFAFDMGHDIAPFLAPKGSVTLNGTSLTINGVSEHGFDVNLIPHTLGVTSWAERQAGDEINLEVDLLARYVARQMVTAGDR